MTAEPAAGLPLHLAREGAGIDVDAASRAAADFLSALGIDIDREDLRETPALLGTLRADPRSRAEFFALAGVPH
jgi:hypothetical protein